MKDATCYSFRRSLNAKISFARTVVLRNSFFPQTVKLWNLLPTDIQESKTLSAFAIRLKKYYGIILSPNFNHLYGKDLKFTVIHCMLRMGYSLLNISKCFRKCACGKTETAEHLLLDCKFTESYRNTLVCRIQSILTNSNYQSKT